MSQGEGDLQALVDGVPVEDGDHRLADGGGGGGGAQIIHGARPIGPEAEGVPAPGEQDDPHVGIGIDALAGLPELRRHQLVHRVADRRTVQRDGRHVLLDSQRQVRSIRRPVGQSNTSTVRATVPAFMSSNASLISSRGRERDMSSSSFSLPWL